jgi:hypothetical protein
MTHTIREEIDKNYETFQAHLPQLLVTYRGKFALLRHQEIIEFFDTSRDAYVAGRKLFPEDQLFSIQEVVNVIPPIGPAKYAFLHSTV